MGDFTDDLLAECKRAYGAGQDFPTIWRTILQKNPFVSGRPFHETSSEGPIIGVSLVTGHTIRFGPKGFALD